MKIHEHNARETARRAHHDASGNDRGAPWRDPTEDGDDMPALISASDSDSGYAYAIR